MSKYLPHLGDKGYINADKSPGEILAYEFGLIFETDYSQSTLWHGKVFSAQWLIAQHGNNPVEMANQLRQSLYKLYTAYYQDVTIEVSPSKGYEDVSHYGLDVFVEAVVDDIPYQLNKSLFVNPDKDTVRIIEAINS